MSIFSSIAGFVSGIFSPAADLIDNLHTSTEEKQKLRNELAKIQAGALEKMNELEGKRLDAMSKVQVAEAGSKFWITAAWRPISSLMMVIVVTAAAFHIIPKPDAEFYELAKYFLCTYAGGRSAEQLGLKIASKLGK